jgi:predicted transcriptional regulator
MLLISIHPEFVDKIFAGEKRVELRRRRPKLKSGDLIAIYATAPRCELVGLARVVNLHESTPQGLWDVVANDAGVDRERYDRYFSGSTKAIGIVLENPVAFLCAPTLEQLRRTWPGFHPPQGFCYLNPEQTPFIDALRSQRPVAA